MAKALSLPNGVRIVTEQRPGTGTVAMQIYLRSGGADEAPDESGLTNLMQEASQTGTTTRTRNQIADDAETKGSPIQSFTNMEVTMFKTKALTRNAGDAFGVLADVILNPTFDAVELEQVKEQIVQSLLQQKKSPAAAAANKFLETAFAGQSLGQSSEGTPELVESYTPAQLKKKHAELLSRPGDIIVSFTGDIDPAVAEKLVADTFGKLQGGAKPASPRATFTAGDYREDNDSNQVNVNIGFRAPDGRDSDRYAMMLFRSVLAGGMSSPLFQELRVKRGLVYTPSAKYGQFDTAGFFSIDNGTGPGKAGELVTAVIELLGTAARDGFPQQDIDQARDRFIRAVRNSTETPDSAAGYNANQIMKFGAVLGPDDLEKNLKAVTADDLRRIAGNMLKDGEFALAAVGPLATLPTNAELKKLMQDQVAGIDIPEKAPVAASVSATFNAQAKAPDSFGAPQVTVLPNGLKVITVERPGPLSIGGWVGAGSDHETPELAGATHLNEHMMFRGTPSYPSGTIDKIVEGEMGGGLNAYTSNDKTVYYFYSLLPAHLQKSVDIIGEMIFQADIKQTELTGTPVTRPDGTIDPGKGEIEAVIEELKMGRDKPGRIAYQQMMAQAYTGSTHGETVIGTEPVLRAMTADMLRDYRDEFYAPNNVIFGAAGPVKHDDFVKLIEQKFGHLQPTNFPPLDVPAYKGGTAAQEHKAAQMATVLLAADAVDTAHADGAAYDALGLILGGGYSSRLAKGVVNTQLALGASAGLSNYRNAGTFMFQAATTPENVKPLIRELYAELRRLPGDVTQAELDKAKGMLELSLRSGYEENNEIIDAYAVDLQSVGKLVTEDEKIKEINALTLDDIRRVAAQVLASNPTASLIVPPGTDPKLLPTHAEVVAMRDDKDWQKPANTNKPKPPQAA
jgi:predicted Zn-dependent peptidase